ncbi:AAA domain-containing protein [Yarrowia lipolytica]|nr:AAA domain-containing protein [Yarrowia lipolytica]KAE8173109.1 AAA domain-containing protein [Yarrowia lipolytica]KAJ8051358.1 AAA domain-containing protein [Yarrowia lipolytica]RMI97025.1 AAA domain-containing protein [Yarrowia lipolytica]
MSLDYLYEHLLEWDLSKLKHEHPRSARSEDALDKYKSSFEYVRIMEPLNLLECYASIRQVFAEFRDQEKARRFGGFRFKVQATKEGDDNELFTEICMGATQQELEEHELFSSTLVVITVPGSGKAKCLGKISEIVWNKKTREMDVWIRTRRADLREGSLWECCYLTNMATAERELLALLSIGDFALKNDILFGQCYSFPKGPDSEIQRLQDKYIGKLNRSQAQAVYGSLNTRGGFSLIQGPPGTGKTSTIVSIIRELLESGSRPLMFCAPSNAAVDELTKRLKKHFLDEKLDYKILRIGRPENVHTEVAHLTLGGMITFFYDNVLKDAPGMELKTARKWHSTEHLPPYMFFNVEGKHKFGDNHSFCNTAEIQFANKLVSAVLKCVGAGEKLDIGIVSPYKQQVEKLRHHFEQRYDTEKETMTLEIQTVDSLQGREKDIIIMSCVRAHPTAHTVGFLADVRRMNVAITRAKASLWIIGNADTLVSNEKWESLLRNANERNVYCEASDFHTREGVYMDNLGISLEALSLE